MRKIGKSVFGTLRLFILLVGCTILFYYGIMWINQEFENYRRYDEPEGAALKVFRPIGAEDSGWFPRLVFFYQNGE